MTIPFSDLLAPVTINEATQAILDVGTALGFNVTAWQSGRAGRVLIAMIARIYSGATFIFSQAAAGGFRDTATGAQLEALSKNMYGVDKNHQSYATGFETLTNGAAVPYTFSPGGLTFTNAVTGASYINTYDATIYGALPGLATLPAPTTKNISAATNASPIAITTTTPHGFATNEQIVIASVGGNLAANGTWTITVTGANTFTLNGSTGSGSYTAATGTASSGVLTIPISALVPGTGSNATGGQITTLNPALLLVTCTNASPLFGSDDESDDALRLRDLAKLGALSPDGHERAYTYMALSVRRDPTDGTFVIPVLPPPQGNEVAYAAATPLDVVRVKVVRSGIDVHVYVSAAADIATANDVTLIDNALQGNVVPVGINETTSSATKVTIPITYTAEIDPAYGVSDADAAAAISTALTAWFADVRKNPIGAKSKTIGGPAYVYVKVLEGVITGALQAAGLPPAIIDADITIPAADVVITASQLAVLDTITSTINDVPQ